MGVAYFLQFLDKLALSQATLFNLRQDLVGHPHQYFIETHIHGLTGGNRICMEMNTHGHLRSFTLDTLPGVGMTFDVFNI